MFKQVSNRDWRINHLKTIIVALGFWLAVSAGHIAFAAETTSTDRFDAAIQSNVTRLRTLLLLVLIFSAAGTTTVSTLPARAC